MIDYLNQAPIIFDDFQKIMNQYDIFDKETAGYFTEDLHNSKAVSNLHYFADVESQLKNMYQRVSFRIFKRDLEI